MTWTENTATFTELGQTILAGRPAFVAYFYADAGFEAHAAAAMDAWLALVPPKTAMYYGHEDSRRYMKITPKAVGKIRDALHAAKKRDRYTRYHIKSADPKAADEAHAYAFEALVIPGSFGYVYVAFPLDHVATQGLDAVVAWFRSWCETFSFTHAGAGLGYEVAWFAEQAQFVYPVMLTTGLRYHGVRVWHRLHAVFHERKTQTLDTAAWLTYLDAASLAQLSATALEALDPMVVQHPCGKGVVLQSGPEADPCDANRPGPAYAALQSINAAIVPIRTTEWAVEGFRVDQTKANSWFERMDP